LSGLLQAERRCSCSVAACCVSEVVWAYRQWIYRQSDIYSAYRQWCGLRSHRQSSIQLHQPPITLGGTISTNHRSAECTHSGPKGGRRRMFRNERATQHMMHMPKKDEG
jgi:hypothetical protein